MEMSVVVQALRAAADRAQTVGQDVQGVNLLSLATKVGDGMPGGRAQRAGDDLAVCWASALTRWGEEVGRHGDALAASADTYHATDHVNASGFEVEAV